MATFRTISRNTQGVRLIKLDEGDSISAVTRVLESENDKENNEQPAEQESAEDSEENLNEAASSGLG